MTKVNRLIVALCAMIVGVAIASADVTESIVFAKGDYNSTYYRIPALVLNSENNVVAICDQRFDSSQDLGYNSAIKLIARVSTDNGTTWSDPAYIAPNLSTCYGDAAVVYDPFTQRIVCLFAAEKNFGLSSQSSYGKIYMTTSADGLVWDEPTDITSQFSSQISGYSGGFISSGRMLYVCPDESTGYLYAVLDAKVGSNAYDVIVRSADHGQTWTVQNTNYTQTPLQGGGNESKLELLSGDRLLLSIRTSGARRFAISDDWGVTWGDVTTSTIAEPGCNGDLMSVSYNAHTYYLQSVPNDASTRKNVSIFFSGNEGTSWTLGHVLTTENSAYSALAQLSNGKIGAFVEVGDDTNGYDMIFYSLSMTDILPAQGISSDYDGTMVCNGQGYAVVEKSDDFSVTPTHPVTITARILLNDYTNAEDVDFGVLSTRWHAANTSTATEHQYDGNTGFEIIAGASEEKSLGANVSIDGDASGNYRGVLNNAYHDNIKPSRWAHIALVMDSEQGYVKLYIDGDLVESQTYSANNSSLVMKGANITNLADLLLGTRYEPVTTDTVTTTTTTTTNNNNNGGWGGNNGGFGGGNNGGFGGGNNSGWGGNSSTTTTTTTTTSYVYEMQISLTRIFNSNIDDVRIYGESFSQEDILNDKESGFPIRTKDETLIAAYDFAEMLLNEDGSAYYFNDISGNGHIATTAGVDGYAFPEILKDIEVEPVNPSYGGTLKVTRFDDGDEIVLDNDGTYLASLNQDFKATAEAEDGWTLVGIYVNGVEVAANGFFKAGKDAIIEARFCKESDVLAFYLVSEVQFNGLSSNKYDREYQFVYNEDEDLYRLEFPGYLQGSFHVEQRIVPSDAIMAIDDDEDLVVLELYSPANDYSEHGYKQMFTGIAYSLRNEYIEGTTYKSSPKIAAKAPRRAELTNDTAEETDDLLNTLFSISPEASTDLSWYMSYPTLTLIYRPSESIRTLSIDGEAIVTAVNDISVTDSSETIYYNLQGIKVTKPTPGLYLTRQGTTIKKAILK